MPIENDPPKPPPQPTPQQILEAEYEQDCIRREQIAAAQKRVAHNSSVKQMYAFIVIFSLCCTSCGLFSFMETKGHHPSYSFDLVERRVVRLYQTGYDPLMSPSAREEWIKKNNEPIRIEVIRVNHSPNIGPTADVLVQRGDKQETDSLYFYNHGLLHVFIPNNNTYYVGDKTRSFTDAAIDVDPSVYPQSPEEIPESFVK